MPEEIPQLGLGTSSESNQEQWADRVQLAIDVGYRHFDTAQAYGNERYVGDGIRRSGVDRADVFVATKTVHPDEPVATEQEILDAVEGCLSRLDTDYIDLLYVHWPGPEYDPETTLNAFDELYDRDTIRHVGVSNFEPDDLDRAYDTLDAPLFANQVECHPLLQQDELREYAVEHDHWLVAYSPLARGDITEIPEIVSIAEKHDVTAAQVSLAWLLSKENVVAIPKASTEAHMVDNLAAQELKLDRGDIELIEGISEERRYITREYASWA